MNFKEYFLLNDNYLPSDIPYGFWFGPTGRIEVVPYEQHQSVAETLLGEMGKTDYENGPYEGLYELGWWRGYCSKYRTTLFVDNGNNRHSKIKSMIGISRPVKKSIQDVFLKYDLYGKWSVVINSGPLVDPLEE